MLSRIVGVAYHIIGMTIDGHSEAFLEMLAAERGAARNTLAAYQADLEDFSVFMRAHAVLPGRASASHVGAYVTTHRVGKLATMEPWPSFIRPRQRRILAGAPPA